MKLHGVNLINLSFNRWLKKYGFKTRVRGMDTDFFWYHDDTISYSLFASESSVENWNGLLEELKCNYSIDFFFSAFLHELGHGRTYWNFTDSEIREYEDTLQLINAEPSSFAESAEYIYTRLPVEYEATRWAVNYINTFPERIHELVTTVGKAVRLFYKLNRIPLGE